MIRIKHSRIIIEKVIYLSVNPTHRPKNERHRTLTIQYPTANSIGYKD